MRLKHSLRKILSVIATSALLFNSLSPSLVVLAQVATPSPTPEATTQPTDQPTIAPSDAPTEAPAPTDAATATPEVVVESTPAADLVAPTPEETLPATQSSTNENAQSQAPPDVSVIPSPAVTPVQPEETGTLSAEVLETALFSETLEENPWFKLITDKLDYAPTEAAVITGTGFTAGETYSLTVTSTDEPATSTTVEVIADLTGLFTYVYQLDGNYRPNYKAEVKDASDFVITSATFTDAPISGCTNDSGRLNDINSTQRDLTRMCVNYAGLSTSINVEWNWDDTSPGGNLGGNTGDACSLYDTDGDGLVNFQLCVIVDGDTSVFQSRALYSCSDAKSDRCTNPSPVSATSTCTASVQNTDPFLGGADHPNDTVASCTVNLSDVGGVNAELVDVCAYSSSQPNSDPADCIIFRDNTGRLEVVKDLVPSDDAGKFNLQIDGVTQATDQGDGGTTGEKVVAVGNRTVGEIAGTGTLLASYSAGIVCKDLNGSGATIASNSNSGPLTVPVVEGEDIVCTITNTLQNGTIIVHKDVVGPNGEALTDTSGTFKVKLDGANEQNITDGGTVTYSNVTAGSHTITESVIPSGYTLYGIGASAGVSGNTAGFSATVSAGLTTDIYVTNRQQNATITIHKNVIKSDGSEVSDTHSFSIKRGGADPKSIAEGTDATYTVAPGAYTFTEDSDANYSLDSITGDNDINPANGASLAVGPGGSASLTFVNKQNAGSISGYKYQSDGTTPISGWTIDLLSCVSAYGSCSQSATTTTNAGGFYSFANLITGFYQVVEALVSTYTPVGVTSYNETVTPGAVIIDKNFSNFKNISISGTKFNDLNGNGTKDAGEPGISSWTINLDTGADGSVDATATTDASGNYSFTNLGPGTYRVREVAQVGWTQTIANPSDITAVDGQNETSINFGNFQLGKITACKFVDANSNGSRDSGDTTLENISMILSKYIDSSWEIQTTQETGTNGCTDFEGLTAGQYRVTEDYGDSDLDNYYPTSGGKSDQKQDFTVTSGFDQTVNFLNAHYRTISGTKYEDANGSGTRDPGEPGLPDWTIYIDNPPYGLPGAGDISTTTDANGDYEFTNLVADQYRIAEVLQTDWAQTQPAIGYYNAEVHFDLTSTGNDFGNFKLGQITVCKYNDLNADSQIDFDETAMAGVMIYLSKNQDPYESHATGENGCYTFAGLTAGDYRISEISPNGFYQTGPVDPAYYDQTVISGTDETFDFLNAEFSTLGDTIYQDNNTSTTQDAGEPGIAGITVNLYKNDGDGIFEPGTDDAFAGTETTDGSGQYIFIDLQAGSYWVDVDESTLPFGFTLTTANDPYFATLVPGTNFIYADFGYVPPVKEISIGKTNDSANTSSGATVTYTLTIKNSGNAALGDVIVTDIIPGGLSYISGSTSGVVTSDPAINGSSLSWNIGTLGAGNSATISYQVKVGDLTNGTYTNYATCSSSFGREEVNCNTASSDVSIGSGQSFGGNLQGQVLGLSTELPATGSPTAILLIALGLLTAGFILKKYAKN